MNLRPLLLLAVSTCAVADDIPITGNPASWETPTLCGEGWHVEMSNLEYGYCEPDLPRALGANPNVPVYVRSSPEFMDMHCKVTQVTPSTTFPREFDISCERRKILTHP